MRGDGIRLCRFFVVRNTLIPAVLVETGFLSNRQEHNKLISPELPSENGGDHCPGGSGLCQ